MDLGFQVMLEAYPKIIEHLDCDNLELQHLLAGAMIFHNGKSYSLGDPIRYPLKFWNVLFSPIGTFSDKWKIFKWFLRLKKLSPEQIFSKKESTSLKHLKDLGFSDKIIQLFFQPFFSGIFLETKLETSSRMLEFVFKMFIEGNAVIPKKGIEEIPLQIANRLFRTKINFNSKVTKVEEGKLHIEGKGTLDSDFTIVSADPSAIVPNLSHNPMEWNRCDNLYFAANSRSLTPPIIGLLAGDYLVNNIFYASSVDQESEIEKELLSVTVIKEHNLSTEELAENVKLELAEQMGIKDLEFIKHFKIDRALPKIVNMQYSVDASETQLSSTIYLTGDYLLNPSQNAAFVAGETVARAILQKLGKA
jgi:hypothetical protein